MTTPTHGSHRIHGLRGPHGRPPSRAEGRRWSRTGSEPTTAMSDLTLRRALSRLFGPLFLAGTVAFSYLAADSGANRLYGQTAYIVFAAVCAACALLAAADLILIHRRMRERREWGRDGGH
jgi:hypothetical protein